MKRFIKRAISLVLVSILALSFCIAGNAESKYEDFDSIISIGDSNAMGYGLDGYQGRPNFSDSTTENYKNDDYKHGVYGSFPELVATALGVERENHVTMCFPAMRTLDAMAFLNCDVELDDYFYDVAINKDLGWEYPALIESGGTYDESDVRNSTIGTNYSDYIRNNADGKQLALIYIGASDVFFTSLAKLGMKTGGLDSSNIVGLITSAIKNMYEGYNQFGDNTEKIIQRVRELDPDCTIVLVGTFNPVRDLLFDEYGALPLLEAMALITNKMNKQYEEIAQRNNAIYVDISNVETASLENDLNVFTILGMTPGFSAERIYHASPAGYEYIARQILEKLEVEDEEVTTDITVDVGSIKSVSSVFVNGIKISDDYYAFDKENHTLTIKCCTRLATRLTFTEDRGESGTYLANYRLSWDKDEGYSAYRLYATRSISRTIKNAFLRPINLFKTISNLLG